MANRNQDWLPLVDRDGTLQSPDPLLQQQPETGYVKCETTWLCLLILHFQRYTMLQQISY